MCDVCTLDPLTCPHHFTPPLHIAQGEHMCDGYTLDPLEVMFVKLKSYTLMNAVSSAMKAVKYQQWMHPELGDGGWATVQGTGEVGAGGKGAGAPVEGQAAAGEGRGQEAGGDGSGDAGVGSAGDGQGKVRAESSEQLVDTVDRALHVENTSSHTSRGEPLEHQDGDRQVSVDDAQQQQQGPPQQQQQQHQKQKQQQQQKQQQRQQQPDAQGQAQIRDINSNEYLSDVPRFKIPKVLEAKARGPSCFDFEFYVDSNPDLGAARVQSRGALWKHYVYFGQFEARRYRFTCPFDYERFMAPDEE